MALIGVLSTAGIVWFFILLIIRTIRRRPKKRPLIGLIVCCVLFSVAINATPDADEKSGVSSAPSRAAISESRPTEKSVKTPEPKAATAPAPTPGPPESPAPSTPAPVPESTPTPAPAPETTPEPSADSSGGGGSNFDIYDNPEQQQTEATWVLNTHTMKIHYPSCSDAKKIAPQNYSTSNLTESELIAQGYSTCKRCH